MKRKNKIIIWIIVVIIIGGGAAYFFNKSKNSKIVYDTFVVERGVLKQTVSSTGKVKSAADLDLNFKTVGKVEKINVKVGRQVKKDEDLASLDLKDLQSAVTEAEANLEVAQANYNKLKAGSRPESIAVSEANVEKAKAAYASAQKDYNNTVQTTQTDLVKYQNVLTDAQTTLIDTKNTCQQDISHAKDNAITKMETYKITTRASLDVIDDTLNNQAAHNTLSVQNKQYLKIAQEDYNQTLSVLNNLDGYVTTAKATKSDDDLKKALNKTLEVLNLLSESLDDTFNVLLATITSSDLSDLALDTLKTNIRTEQTNTNTAITVVQSAKQTLEGSLLAYTTKVNVAQATVNSANDALNQIKIAQQTKIDTAQAAVTAAKRALEITESQLALEKAPARPEDLDLSLAQVKQTEAALAIAQNQLADNILKAPVDGVITAVNYEIGEQTSLTKPVMTMYSEGMFAVEVDVSEADIAKVKINDSVRIDFDAFGSEVVFDGQVTYIDPAETVIQDVVYYQVKINFDWKNYEIKPGLTANVEILTAEKDNVLKILQRAVYERDGQKYVKVLLSANQELEKPVKLGLRGDDGLVEVVEGLNEGEKVVVGVKNGKK